MEGCSSAALPPPHLPFGAPLDNIIPFAKDVSWVSVHTSQGTEPVSVLRINHVER